MIHTIQPGFFCVPSAIQAITGEDMLSVIMPALNRHKKSPWLLEEILEADLPVILKTLNELGYYTGLYKNTKTLGNVESWRDRYFDETILLLTKDHCLVLYKGLVYDNHTPTGKTALNHTFSLYKVRAAYLIRKLDHAR